LDGFLREAKGLKQRVDVDPERVRGDRDSKKRSAEWRSPLRRDS